MAEGHSVVVYRKYNQLVVYDSQGQQVLESPIGIGRGGYAEKKSMSDFVTPTGEFEVDLIVSSDSSLNAVATTIVDRYKSDKVFSSFIDGSPAGLAKLYKNMNSLDFDDDGKADEAYGVAYIGLNSDSAVTGPKMRYFKGVPYWYSIALHGTPNEQSDIGAANSGGCVHLTKASLLELVRKGLVGIGTRVKITDQRAGSS